jgi:acyl-CoA synthetase (NDP forming)
MQAYPNVASLPETPDMVAIAVPRDAVPGVIEECAQRGVRAAVILADGFVERDAHGAALQAHVSATARESGLLVVGPNCFGTVSVVNRCAAFSVPPPTWPGNVALISHSGGLLLEFARASSSRGFGFSHLVSAGNEAGVTAADYIDYFVADPFTDVILGIIESVRDPESFVAACSRALAARKPIALLKMGVSQKGARAAATHTGAVAGSPAVHAALFRQKGIIQVGDLDELVDMGSIFSSAVGLLRQRRLERAAFIGISGGGKDLVCDTAEAAGVEFPELSEVGAEKLRAVLSDEYYATNPVDIGGTWADTDKSDIYPVCLEVFASEPDVDMVISDAFSRAGSAGIRARLVDLEIARAAHPDRLFALLARTTDGASDEWSAAIREGHLVFLQGYGRGMRALGRLAEYSRFLHGDGAVHAGEEQFEGRRLSADHAAAGLVLDEIETKQILTAAGIPMDGQATAAPGLQIILRAIRDPQFGPLIAFGLSGTLEVLDDFALRVAPLTANDARAMLGEIRARRLLDGFRGQPSVDRAAIENALVQLSNLMLKRPDIVSIDVDPAFAYRRGLVAVDARIELMSDQ